MFSLINTAFRVEQDDQLSPIEVTAEQLDEMEMEEIDQKQKEEEAAEAAKAAEAEAQPEDSINLDE